MPAPRGMEPPVGDATRLEPVGSKDRDLVGSEQAHVQVADSAKARPVGWAAP